MESAINHTENNTLLNAGKNRKHIGNIAKEKAPAGTEANHKKAPAHYIQNGHSVHAILERLENVRQSGPDRWMALCPAHDDRSPSLSIRDVGDKLLLKCFAGCDTADVLAAVGLNWSDVMPSSSPREKEAYTRSQNVSRLRQVLDHERLVVQIAKGIVGPLSQQDAERVSLAKHRIKKAEGMLNA